MPTALIIGITGQDGSYLAELLLGKGYTVYGLVRRASSFNTSRIDHLYADPHSNPRLKLVYGDLSDANCLAGFLNDNEPDEVYNLGAQSHVRVSFDQPIYSFDIAATGTLRVLEAIRHSRVRPRYYQASSSEMYGAVLETPQRESTPFNPRSPYAVGKVAAYHHTVNYRLGYGIFACNGILFNHESPRRGETFVTRKITRAATRIKLGLQDKLYLGNLDAKRDWGFAGDYVEAMWLMLQQDSPGDYVVATGKTWSIRQFLDAAFGQLDLDWRGYVELDERYKRPTEVELLLGDPSKAHRELGWAPRVDFAGLVQMMVEHDQSLAEEEYLIKHKLGRVHTPAHF